MSRVFIQFNEIKCRQACEFAVDMPDIKRMVSSAQQFDNIARSNKVLAIGDDLAECLINDARLTLRFAQFRPIGKVDEARRL